MSDLGYWAYSVIAELVLLLMCNSLSGDWSSALDTVSDSRDYVTVDVSQALL